MKQYRMVNAIRINLDEATTAKYFETFDHSGWLDVENVIIKRCANMTPEEIGKYEEFFVDINLRSGLVEYLIIHHS